MNLIFEIMNNEKFYKVVERKNDFIVRNVEYLQIDTITHTIRKSVLHGKKVLGFKTYEVENPRYKTELEYEKMICKTKSDLLPYITVGEYIYE